MCPKYMRKKYICPKFYFFVRKFNSPKILVSNVFLRQLAMHDLDQTSSNLELRLWA